MALPATYGPEANDGLDQRVAKIHALMWDLLHGVFSASVNLNAGDIQLGAVELQDSGGVNRATVDSSGALSVNTTKLGTFAINLGAGNVGAGTQRVTLAGDDPGVVSLAEIVSQVTSSNTSLTSLQAATEGDYETVAAGQTDQMLGPTGAAGDYLSGLLVIPATTSPGGISIEDGATNIPVFAGGANSVTSLAPFFIPLGIRSVSGGWEVTTGTNVAVIGIGKFT